MVKQTIDRFAAYPTRLVFSLHPPASKPSHAAYDVLYQRMSVQHSTTKNCSCVTCLRLILVSKHKSLCFRQDLFINLVCSPETALVFTTRRCLHKVVCSSAPGTCRYCKIHTFPKVKTSIRVWETNFS
jgi:hypothetical protein